MERVMKIASQKAVVIFSSSSCCMCHTVERLLSDMGVNPLMYDIEEDKKGKDMERALAKLVGQNPALPAVFIGGKLAGSANKIMSLHLAGKLVPLLHDAECVVRDNLCNQGYEFEKDTKHHLLTNQPDTVIAMRDYKDDP